MTFLSDNGYFLGNLGLEDTLPRQEASIRISMFTYWNKLKINQAKTKVPILSTLVFATILYLAGLPIPDLQT